MLAFWRPAFWNDAEVVLLLTIYPEPHCVREEREVAPACPRSLRGTRPPSGYAGGGLWAEGGLKGLRRRARLQQPLL